MAELPRYFAQPGLPSLRLPEKQNVWGPIFGQLSELSFNLAEQTSPLDVARANDEFKLRIDDLQTKASAEPNLDAREKMFTDEARKAQTEILAKYPNRRTQNVAAAHMENALTGAIINVRAGAIKARIESNLEFRDQKRDELSLLAGQSSDPVEREKARNEYAGIINALAVGPMPAIHPSKIREEMQKFDILAVTENAVYRTSQKGEGYKVLAEYYSGKFDSLPLANRDKIRSEVNQTLANLEKIDKQAKAVDLEKWNVEFADLLNAPDTGGKQSTIDAKLKEGLMLGMSGGEYRAWESRARADLSTDRPDQIVNKEKFLSDFRLKGYSPENLAQAKKTLEVDYLQNRIGNKGREAITAEFARVEAYLKTQARIEAGPRSRPDKDTLPEAMKSIRDMYSRTQQNSSELRGYINELDSRAGVRADPAKREDPGVVARDIEKRIKQQREKDTAEMERKRKEKAERDKGGVSKETLNAIQTLSK